MGAPFGDEILSNIKIRSLLLSCAAGRTKDSVLRRKSDPDREEGTTEPGSPRRGTASRKIDTPDADAAPGVTVQKAVTLASAAGSWAMEAGERHGKRLLQFGRDWLAGETRQDEARLEDAEIGKGDSEQDAPGVVSGTANGKEGRLGVSKERDSSLGDRDSIAREGSASGVGGTGREIEGHGEEAWRRGNLDEPDKR